ncbi:MAG: formate--tetrahydrofolate ligase [Candidatus Omnitrophica bacterium]|nr:formate--tetrahydrofolate ligase [Candidatus Omnitrophota bacterium]
MPGAKSETFKIAQNTKLLPIEKIAQKIGISGKYLENYGMYKAKITDEILKKSKSKKDGKYILVTAITPTPLGEGKTVTTIGLSMAFNKLGKTSIACLREPSLGPIFGTKGVGTGGGYSQVLPCEEINLHFTGDMNAVAAAHNLCAAYLDNSIFRGNPHHIDTDNIIWDRVLDVSDRVLRNIQIGMGSKNDGVPRKSNFSITAASELMSILALSENIHELRKRIGRIIVAYTKDKKPVTTEDLKVAGAMTVLLKEAIKPNLVQTIENTPAIIHTGPFANIAHGSNSIIADKIALKFSEYVVTEGGFGADIGAEKFFNIKCRQSGLKPDAVVLVCSIRALKMHSGDFEIKGGKPLESSLFRENISAIERGSSNLDKQIENLKVYGVPVVVCINKFATDTEKEINAVKRCAMSAGADDCVVSEMWAKGSQGGLEVARSIIKIIKDSKSIFRFLYPLDLPIKDKISRIAKSIYGAKEVVFSEHALEKMKFLKKINMDNFPICMAKTQFSLSHDPKRKGRPRNFKLPVSDMHISSGAGFIYVICGDIRTMPGLPENPAGFKMDIDKNGEIVGMK